MIIFVDKVHKIPKILLVHVQDYQHYLPLSSCVVSKNEKEEID